MNKKVLAGLPAALLAEFVLLERLTTMCKAPEPEEQDGGLVQRETG